MSQSYIFDILTQTANGKVNPDVLAQQIADTALPTGGTFEGVSIEGGTPESNGVIDGGNLILTWQNALDPADVATQTALVLAHQGAPFGSTVQRASSEPVSSTTNDGTAPVSKISATAAPLPAGKYLVGAYCETRLAASLANSGVRAVVIFNGNQVAEDNWGEDQWHAFSGQTVVDVDAGDEPMLEIQFHRIGVLNTVEIRRARITISQQSD